MHECNECNFISGNESIFLDRGARERTKEQIIFCGRFTMPGWSGHADFYAFLCVNCGGVVTDHAHGYTSDGYYNGLLYFICSNCDSQTVIYDDNVYIENGLPPLPSFWSELKNFLRLRLRVKNSN